MTVSPRNTYFIGIAFLVGATLNEGSITGAAVVAGLSLMIYTLALIITR